jgi:hypothetical protein
MIILAGVFGCTWVGVRHSVGCNKALAVLPNQNIGLNQDMCLNMV